MINNYLISIWHIVGSHYSSGLLYEWLKDGENNNGQSI